MKHGQQDQVSELERQLIGLSVYRAVEQQAHDAIRHMRIEVGHYGDQPSYLRATIDKYQRIADNLAEVVQEKISMVGDYSGSA